MATAKRVIQLDVTTTPGARSAVRDLNKRLRTIEGNSEKAARSLKKMGSNINFMSIAAKAFIALNFAQRLAGFSDSLTQVNARLKLVTDGTEDLARVSEELFGVADRSRTSYVATGELYARLALATKSLGISSQELLNTTEGLSNAILLSGASAQEAKALLIQVSQAMAKGKLDGDEFRSVMENGSYAADLLAKSLGVTRGELFELSKAGKLTTDVMLNAWGGAVDETRAKVDQMPLTFGQAFTKIENAFARLLQQMAPMINQLADWLASTADLLTATVQKIEGAARYIAKLTTGSNSAVSRADQLLAEERRLLKERRGLLAEWDRLEDTLSKFPDREQGLKALQNAFNFLGDEILGVNVQLKALGAQEEGLGAGKKFVAPPPIADPTGGSASTPSPEKSVKALKEVVSWQDQYRNSLIASQTEIERFTEYVNILDNLYFDGAIGLDVYNQELEKLTGQLGENTIPAVDEFSDAMKTAIAGSVVDSIGSMTDAFVDFAITGKQSFRELTASILSDISKMILKMVVLNALKTAFGGTPFGNFLFPTGAPSFATGTPYVPQDGLAYLHKGERVVPAAQNNNTTNNYTNEKPISIVNVTDPGQVAEVMAGSMGEEIIINTLRRNPDLVKQAIA